MTGLLSPSLKRQSVRSRARVNGLNNFLRQRRVRCSMGSYNRPADREDGLSLIETALLLLILSLLLLPVLEMIKLRQTAARQNNTQGHLATVTSALHQFALRNGRYPAPAHRNLAATDANFGREVPFSVSATPLCGGGDALMCRTLGRDTTIDADSSPDFVLIGDVPIAALGLEPQAMLDGFGTKFTYAITAHLTNDAFFDENTGAIRVIDASGNNHDGTDGNAHFVLVSHGADQRGGFSISGMLVSTCGGGGVFAKDHDNCNNDGVFNTNAAPFTTEFGTDYGRQQSLVLGANYYDDYVSFAIAVPGDLWGRIATDSMEPDIFKRSSGRIRVGAVPPGSGDTFRVPVAMVEVIGDVATDRMLTARICPYPTNRSTPTANCSVVAANAGAGLVAPQYLPGVFTPSIIGGAVSTANANKAGGGIDCGGRGITGIGAANEECNLQQVNSVGLLGGLLTHCTPDPNTGISRYPRGVNANGTPICERP